MGYEVVAFRCIVKDVKASTKLNQEIHTSDRHVCFIELRYNSSQFCVVSPRMATSVVLRRRGLDSECALARWKDATNSQDLTASKRSETGVTMASCRRSG